MTVRNYSSIAEPTTLSSGVSDSATTIPVASTTGFPATPFILALDHDVAGLEELVSVTGVASLNLTVTRGYDSTPAVSHLSGASVRHVIAGIDLQNSRDHEESSTDVHGLSGGAAVVGTTSTQTLTNKTLSSGSITGTFTGNPTFTGTFSATGIGGKVDVRKTADETVSNNTTLQNDDHLVLSVVANAVYKLEAYVIYDGNAFGDIKLGWTAPASSTLNWSTQGGGTSPVSVDGVLITAGTAGSLTLQWAQNTSNATGTTVKIGSYLALRRVA